MRTITLNCEASDLAYVCLGLGMTSDSLRRVMLAVSDYWEHGVPLPRLRVRTGTGQIRLKALLQHACIMDTEGEMIVSPYGLWRYTFYSDICEG